MSNISKASSISLPIVPGRGLVSNTSTDLRIKYLDGIGLATDQLSITQLELTDIRNNIESYIGTVEIPLGLVGPLIFNSNNGGGEMVYCAAGTLEGALIASMNRGAKAISLSGGFNAEAKWQRMSRVPMFIFESSEAATAFSQFIPAHFIGIKKVAESYSNHAQLIEIKVVQLEEVVNLRFMYTTGDASGQNMTTTCTWHSIIHIAKHFEEVTGITPINYVIEGNGASDKKVSLLNIEIGRGIHVSATCFLSEKVIHEVLRTTSSHFIQCYKPSIELAKKDGMTGYNINVANAIAAIYVATGQDLASIHESGVGFLSIEKVSDGLNLKLTLPNLVIGSIGGGTHLKKQAQALEMMGCLGNGKVERFASIIAGFALGLEISTFAAIVSGEFSKAHEKLGRNKPVKWLLKHELTKSFLSKCLIENIEINHIIEFAAIKAAFLENGIITEVAARINKKLIGFVPLQLTYTNTDNTTISKRLLLKSKALDRDVIKGLHLIAASINPQLSDLLNESKNKLEYKNCHIKEIDLYCLLHKNQYKHIPVFYGRHVHPEREIYFFIQELMDYSALSIVNSENHPEHWLQKDVITAIEGITKFHQLNFSEDEIVHIQEFKPWDSLPLYSKLLDILLQEDNEYANKANLKSLQNQLERLEAEAAEIRLPKTVIHNDFNPRNSVIKKDGSIVIYDWELAVIDFPHRDICEFLSFVLPENFTEEQLLFYLKYHFQLYHDVSWTEWLKACRYSLKVYIATRASFYEVAGILIKYEFSARILNTAFRMLHILKDIEHE